MLLRIVGSLTLVALTVVTAESDLLITFVSDTRAFFLLIYTFSGVLCVFGDFRGLRAPTMESYTHAALQLYPPRHLWRLLLSRRIPCDDIHAFSARFRPSRHPLG